MLLLSFKLSGIFAVLIGILKMMQIYPQVTIFLVLVLLFLLVKYSKDDNNDIEIRKKT
jgi:uncharacterized membrane protein